MQGEPQGGWAHLVLHLVLDWSYAEQRLVPVWDERRLDRARRQQKRFSERVLAFYRGCRLDYPIMVHRQVSTTGKPTRWELGVAEIP